MVRISCIRHVLCNPHLLGKLWDYKGTKRRNFTIVWQLIILSSICWLYSFKAPSLVGCSTSSTTLLVPVLNPLLIFASTFLVNCVHDCGFEVFTNPPLLNSASFAKEPPK
ncbi:unnamed protein product, partial [Vitis vinifera]